MAEISEGMYKKHLEKLLNELHEVEVIVDKAKALLVPRKKMKEKAERIINKLPEIWNTADLKTKRLIQSLIFPEGVFYNKLTDRILIKTITPGFFIGTE